MERPGEEGQSDGASMVGSPVKEKALKKEAPNVQSRLSLASTSTKKSVSSIQKMLR